MYLLDVNVLFALSCHNHIHSGAAQDWLENRGLLSVATCASTESSLLRLLCNRVINEDATPIEGALEVLKSIRSNPRHVFWNKMPSPREPVIQAEIAKCRGYRQIPDAYLIGLAKHHGAKLATLDTKLLETFGSDGIELIPS